MFRYPLAWACLFLFLGLSSVVLGWFSLVIIFFALLLAISYNLSKKDFFTWLLLGCTGFVVTQITNIRPQPKAQTCLLLPTENIVYYSWGVVGKGKLYSLSGKLLGTTSFVDFAPKDSLYSAYYWVEVSHQKICENPLPIGFNEKTFFDSKGIKYKVIIQKRIPLQALPASTLKENIRKRLQQKIEKPLHFNLMWALLSGDKSTLSKEHKVLFQELGIVHVLAVSGLHIGLVGSFFYALLYPFKKYSFIAPIGSMVCVWGYCTFVGFSPSVSRAFFLFCVYMTSQLLNRKPKKYLVLWFSFVILIFLNPQSLFSIGFQLSFGAVLGIISLMDITSMRVKKIKSRWLSMVVKFALVSVGAQLGTLPFVLYYFHGFPTYFLVANLLAIPVVTAALYLLLMGMIALFLGIPSEYIFDMVGFLFDLLFKAGHIISTWPYHYTEGIYPSKVFTVFLLLGLLLFFVHRAYKPLIYISLLLLCVAPWIFTPSVLKDQNTAFCHNHHETVFKVKDGEGVITCSKKNHEHFYQQLTLLVKTGFLHRARLEVNSEKLKTK